MNLRTLVAMLVFGALLLTLMGCGGNGGGGGTATVIGMVRDDASMQTLANATVRISDRASTQTGPDGRFTVVNAPTGSQTLTITAAGHDTFHGAVQLVDGTNSLGTCYVAPVTKPGCGGLTGTLVLPSGDTVDGGTVRSGPVSAVSRSDGSGRFTLYNVPAGSAQVTFYDPGTSANTTKWYTVRAGGITDVGDVLLEFQPPPPPG